MEAIKILNGLLTPLIALLTAYIYYNQYRLGKNMLRINLFDKRYQVYKHLYSTFEKISSVKGMITNEDYYSFFRNLSGYKFLFEDDTIEYIEVIKNKVFDLYLAIPSLDNPKYKTEFDKLVYWFEFEKRNIDRKFMKYFIFKEAFFYDTIHVFNSFLKLKKKRKK